MPSLEAHQPAAEYRSHDQPDRGDHRIGAHRQAELAAREGVGDARARVREDQRPADALDDRPQDQLPCRRARQARAQRREGEQGQPAT